MSRTYLKKIKRIVVKIGTRSLTEKVKIAPVKIKKITKELSDLKRDGYEIILVTSGAISSGIGEIKLNRKPKSMPEKQAVASIGQITLMTHYHEYFNKHNIKIGQVLITESDLKVREKYLNIKNTLITLIQKFKIIPIVNENDVVGIDEIIFGENDVLSALIANLIGADLLILLSDVDGFFYKGEYRSEIKKLTKKIMDSADGTWDKFSSGGMKSKLEATKKCINSGIPVVIANSSVKNIIKKIVAGEDFGTYFHPLQGGLSHKKRWLAYSVVPQGKIHVDEGAEDALINHGKSLLASGIIKIEGDFKKGDPVDIINLKGDKIGRGRTNYNDQIIIKIKGKNTQIIRNMLKNNFYSEVIHRNNLVIF